jgi:bacterioferritin
MAIASRSRSAAARAGRAASAPPSAPQPAAQASGTAGGREALIRALNGDLSSEYQAAIMYVTYAAQVDGPYRPQLAALFKSEVPGELAHAQFLADKVAALGGTPATDVPSIPVPQEAREMLEAVLHAEEDAIRRYRERIDQAEAFGDIGLKVQLENIIAEETGHRDEVRRILEGWSQ